MKHSIALLLSLAAYVAAYGTDVLCIYYPEWHVYPEGEAIFGKGHSEWDYVDSAKPRFPGHEQPLRLLDGHPDDSNPADVAKEIDYAADSGIDAFVYDWYWADHRPIQHEALERGFLKAANRKRIKFALMWANHNRSDVFRTAPGKCNDRFWWTLKYDRAEFLEAVDYCIAHYFAEPNYYRKDGKTFLSIYSAHELVKGLGGPEKTKAVFAEAQARMKAAGLPPLHLSAMVRNADGARAMAAAGFDSASAYNITPYEFDDSQVRQETGETRQLFTHAEFAALHVTFNKKVSDGSPVPFIPVATRGWDPSPRCRLDEPFPWRTLWYPYLGIVKDLSPDCFARSVRAALRVAEESPKKPGAILINAWNEYTEGCYLMPDAKNGDAYLKALRRALIDKLCPPRPETTARFRAGAYPPAAQPYRAAALKAFGYMTSLPAMRTLVETGEPEQTYQHNAYVSKTHAAHVLQMLGYARAEPAKRAEAMRFAKASAEYLLTQLEPPDAPLAWWPPTYGRTPLRCSEADKAKSRQSMVGNEPAGAVKYRGEVMLLYPADVGIAFVAYYRETKDARCLKAAVGIAETYLKTRRADGSWPLKMRLATGEVIGENTLVPNYPMALFNALHEATGEAKWAKASDACFAWLEANPLADWNWDGQFEDIKPEKPYANPTKHNAVDTMLEILRRFPNDPKRIAQCREILDFCEKRFVCWERPANHPNWKDMPAVLEQYSCFVPIDASADKMIRGYLALWRVTKAPVLLEKARALGDTITRVQLPDGRIPTFWTHDRYGDVVYDWLNCLGASAQALLELAEATGTAQAAPAFPLRCERNSHMEGEVLVIDSRNEARAFGWRRYAFNAEAKAFEPGGRYRVRFRCKVEGGAPGAFLYVLVRPLGWNGNEKDVLTLRIEPTGGAWRTFDVPFEAGTEPDYRLQFHSMNRIRAEIADVRITPRPSLAFAPAVADAPKYAGELGPLPTGAKEFDVDLPQPGTGLVLNAADFGVSEANDDNTAALRAAFAAAKDRKASRLDVAKGTYRLGTDSPLALDDFRDFTFDGHGATFVSYRKSGSFMRLRRCERVRLKDFNVDWDWTREPLASIVKVVRADASSFDVQFVDYADFPNKHAMTALFSAYDPKTRSVGFEGGLTRYLDHTKAPKDRAGRTWLNGNTLRIEAPMPGFAVGQLYRAQHFYYHFHGFQMEDNAHLRLENVTVLSTPGHAFVMNGRGQHHTLFDHVDIVAPKDDPRRVITCTADHLHIAQSRGFIKLDGCEFSLGADDIMNMHDNTAFAQKTGAKTVRAQNASVMAGARPGDRIELRHGDYSPTGFTGTFVSARRVAEGRNDFDVTFAEALPEVKKDGFVLFNWAYDTHNVIVRNCTFHDNRARGLLILARDVTVEDNVFRHQEMGAIKIETGYTHDLWSEGYGVSNVVIRGNVFDNSNPSGGYGGHRERTIYAGVYLKDDPSSETTDFPIIRDLLIERNRFRDNCGVTAYLSSVRNVLVRDNVIEDPTPRRQEKPYRSQFYLTNASDVRIVNNTYRASPNVKRPGVVWDPETCSRVLAEGNRVLAR